MATDRNNGKTHWSKVSRILADSANAKHRFGFAGEPGSPITQNTPKLSDLWFIEYKPVSGNKVTDLSHISALAKAVSPISIQTSTMPIDQYGKRVYVPTRVDFPEVTITMYDTIDGQMFGMAKDIYSKFFKNQDAEVTGANAEQVLTSAHEHGRKLPDDSHSYYHQHFEKITIFHFFGNLEPFSSKDYLSGTHPKNAGQGSVQKIELINPLVTNIAFSPSDYSVGDLRTMDFSVQPENIIIGDANSVTFPDWMTWGMDYMMSELVSTDKSKRWTDLYPEPVFEFKNSIFRQGSKGREDGNENYEDAQGNKRTNKFGNDDRTQSESLTDPLRIEEQENKDTNRKLFELMKLYNVAISNPMEADNNAALEADLKNKIGVIDLARSKRFSNESSKTYIDEGNQFPTPYEATYTNPDIPTFGGIGDSNPPGSQFPGYSTDLGSGMIRELIGAFLGKRKFDVTNIISPAAIINKMIGNDGTSESRKIFGSILTSGMTNSKRGAYATTTKAQKPITTVGVPVFKTDSPPGSYGVSRVITRKL